MGERVKEIWYICESIKSVQLLRVAGKEKEWDWKGWRGNACMFTINNIICTTCAKWYRSVT